MELHGVAAMSGSESWRKLEEGVDADSRWSGSDAIMRSGQAKPAKPAMWGIVSWLWGSEDANAAQIRALRKEIETLDILAKALAEERNRLHAKRARQLASSTVVGRVFDALGYFFSGYCVYKVRPGPTTIINARTRAHKNTCAHTRAQCPPSLPPSLAGAYGDHQPCISA